MPDPDGPLSTEMPSSSIQAANKVVKPVLEEMKAREAAATAKKRGQYKSYTVSEKAMIAKRATECKFLYLTLSNAKHLTLPLLLRWKKFLRV